MSRLKVVHSLEFVYDRPAQASYNEVRIFPVQELDQTVLASSLTLDPPMPVRSSTDGFGNTVGEFELLQPHTRMSLTAETVVAVQREEIRPPVISVADVVERTVKTMDLAETVVQTKLTEPPEDVAKIAASLMQPEDTNASARAIAERIGADIEYVTGVTTVHSSAADVWELRRGVCQDIAHVTLGALRSVGIPARYVSGYLHPSLEPQLGQTVPGEAHAWVEWFAGRWVGFDPTNSLPIGERHVVVGRGRDYGDVPPLRGVFDGDSSSRLEASVTVTLLA
ncbi:transglutaminase family protein [Galactobacter caseinivorans]|uniref:Transglutaminase family protein n=1 Tax=Galactobacter caseinivorans TaxID=2676123 RepID=A0A496PLM4_9MICC|nr:transglutaminase family protein [Galactobacter caseinivorans]RKW71379.1 transglutaminase family protein [Galactobacter caseinivorans]